MRGILRVDLAHIQLVPSGLLSNRLVPSFRRRYSAQSRALSTTPPEFSPERCRHPATSPPAHQSIVFVNNVNPWHFLLQFIFQCAFLLTQTMTPWLPSSMAIAWACQHRRHKRQLSGARTRVSMAGPDSVHGNTSCASLLCIPSAVGALPHGSDDKLL